jgi:hypothetical protein
MDPLQRQIAERHAQQQMAAEMHIATWREIYMAASRQIIESAIDTNSDVDVEKLRNACKQSFTASSVFLEANGIKMTKEPSQ